RMIVGGEIVARGEIRRAELDRSLERSARAPEVWIEARELLAGAHVELREVDEDAIAVERELHRLVFVAEVLHLEHHLVARLVERIATNRELRDRDVPLAVAHRDERELHVAEAHG